MKKQKKIKLKTHKGLSKRFKVTATGKVTRNAKRMRKYGYTHSKSSKNTDKKSLQLAKPEAKKIKKLLGK
ncbi:MAG: bL35 family ribosomal protein [Candidatus Dojkabacteria bacterium]|nr:bL35 family ribosomal protein [Candidatus Dojkabacteria bacterium]MDQ7020434.1 bL35 family ribosomal protein [Candidatus Dojkabacteria bacterium]